MKVYAISDIHVDYDENRKWLFNLSEYDYQNDILILAGDVTDSTHLLNKTFEFLKNRFAEILYTPGNHELWVCRDTIKDSFSKFHLIQRIAFDCGVKMALARFKSLSIVPLFGWYDYSFGYPEKELKDIWTDYSACKWPNEFDEEKITRYFTSLNLEALNIKNDFVISFSHFVPRIDLMPPFIPRRKKMLYSVLGSTAIERQIRQLMPDIHVYGHSHVNQCIWREKILYINNAFGYPKETTIASKKLICIAEE